MHAIFRRAKFLRRGRVNFFARFGAKFFSWRGHTKILPSAQATMAFRLRAGLQGLNVAGSGIFDSDGSHSGVFSPRSMFFSRQLAVNEMLEGWAKSVRDLCSAPMLGVSHTVCRRQALAPGRLARYRRQRAIERIRSAGRLVGAAVPKRSRNRLIVLIRARARGTRTMSAIHVTSTRTQRADRVSCFGAASA